MTQYLECGAGDGLAGRGAERDSVGSQAGVAYG